MRKAEHSEINIVQAVLHASFYPLDILTLRGNTDWIILIVSYLANGKFPKEFSSTKNNFVRKAKKFQLGKKKKLLRGGLQYLTVKTFYHFLQGNLKVSLFLAVNVLYQLFFYLNALKSSTHFINIGVIRYIFWIPAYFWGRDKCLQIIKERYYWPGMWGYISKKTKECVACSYKKGVR